MITKLLIVSIIALSTIAAIDVKQMHPAHQAVYGAMRAGWLIGASGGTEAEMQNVFLRINAGDTNAVQDWLNAQSKRLGR
jgi:hypothetical protein